MIAAIYARKSTEQNGVGGEAKSVTRQVEHGRAYAIKRGWEVADEHVYVDDAVSGAEFVKRPGFLRLMNALKPRPGFQVLIMSEESRLGRESIETSYALKQIVDAGVRVFFYLSDQERKLDNALDKVMLSLANFASEMERERASQRTHDAMLKKARAGYVTGGKVYGYDNETVYADDCGLDGARRRLHVVRRINVIEASVVRRIFERYAHGYGLGAIAKELNAEGILPPTQRRAGWAPSCIREILLRQLYRGIIVWNKTQAIQRGGTQKSRKRPESEWLKVEAPDLRIVPEEIWQQVAGQFMRARTLYARTTGGRLLGRPSGADLRSEYLLSGMAKCALCGGSIVCQKRGTAKHTYMCAYHHKRGPAVCTNALHVRMTALDAAVLDAIRGVLDECLLTEAVGRAVAELRANHVNCPDERRGLEHQLAMVETRLQHLVGAIASGRATESVYAELQKEEAAKKMLAERLTQVDRVARLGTVDAKQIERTLVERVVDMKGLLGRHIPQTRQIIRRLIPERIVCAPFDDARGRGYAVSASGSYAGLLSEKALVNYGGGGEGS